MKRLKPKQFGSEINHQSCREEIILDVSVLCSCSEALRQPARSQEEEGGGGEGGGADLQRGGSQQQRAATLQVHLRLLHGSAARLGQLHREGERISTSVTQHFI